LLTSEGDLRFADKCKDEERLKKSGPAGMASKNKQSKVKGHGIRQRETPLTKEQLKAQKIKEIGLRLAAVLEEARAGGSPQDQLTLHLDSLESQVDHSIIEPSKAARGRSQKLDPGKAHLVLGSRLEGPWPSKFKVVVLATGCFWGTEKGMWRLPGIHSTAVGYAAGYTPNPTYEEVCSGRTGATEAVQVVYNPEKISLVDILRWFWQSHDPTQGMRQGNDRGTQYRSGLYYFDTTQRELMEASKAAYEKALHAVGRTRAAITTEIRSAADFRASPGAVFYYAENYHQQYLAKPDSRPYCSAEPLLVSLPAFREWSPCSSFEKHSPLLSEAFWKQHAPRQGCVVKAPNEPIQQ
jgi:peptide-methionine (S)-S-oxide reductase